MNQFKGVVLRVRIEFLKQRGGQDLLNKICRRLASPYQELIEKSRWVLPAWYPWELLENLQAAIMEELGGGKVGILQEVGRFGAELNVKGVYRLIFIACSPEFLVPRAAAMWVQQFRNGQLHATLIAPKTVRVQLCNFEGNVKQIEQILQGWTQRVAELSGAKQVRIIPQTPAEAEVSVQFQATWV